MDGLRATYRLQLSARFGFDAAAAVVPYLSELGISHLYSSPILQAEPGSTHGYDVVDHRRVNVELGGSEALDRLVETLRAHGLGLVVDIVPNHMAIGSGQNRWWWDVLQNGRASRYAGYFDVDWEPPERRLHNVILLPVLADHYGRVLESGDLRLAWDGNDLTIRHGESSFPLDPRSLADLLAEAAERSGSEELAFVASALGTLPPSTTTEPDEVARRERDSGVLLERLRALAADRPVAAALDASIAAVNEDTDRLAALLDAQNYRLAYWRASQRDLGYRRFFDINTLVGLRVEEERVFADTHELIVERVARGDVAGLRVDHPDGLRDPRGYLERLRSAAGSAWLVIEKILEREERLRPWPVDGTTGYRFLNLIGGLFVDPAAEGALGRLYAEFTGKETEWQEVARDAKLLVLREVLGSDLNRLTGLFVEICERNRRYRDFTRHELHEALGELIAAFGVYRTYVRAEPAHVAEDDRRFVTAAVDRARARRPDLDAELFELLGRVLLLVERGEPEDELAMRFQQLTPAAMAKGVEDTAFYRFNRFVALNEVGGDPSRFGGSLEEFHEMCRRRQERWPMAMSSTSTHDTKRSEDVRARLAVLSQVPDLWAAAVREWSAAAERYRSGPSGDRLPDRNSEYLLYQTLVGAWPLSRERARGYLEKASREAKQATSWTAPNERYDDALRSFVDGVLSDAQLSRRIGDFASSIADAGRRNALAQLLLKLTAPGVPDLYQGSELWDLSLVDPDNRRPVDFELRRRMLALTSGMRAEEAWARRDEGLTKLWLTARALALRCRRPKAFGRDGGYRPLHARGPERDSVVAYLRGDAVAVAVPRLLPPDGAAPDARLALPSGRWTDALAAPDDAETLEGTVPAAILWRRFPVSLLERR